MAPRRLMDMSTVVLLVAFTVYLSPATARSSSDGGGSTPGIDALSTGGGNTGEGESLVPSWQGDSDAHPNRRLLDSERCGVANDSLIGGEDPELLDYPWLAFLQYQTSRGCRISCRGALINSRYVLTAAHCVKKMGITTLVGVRLGEHNLNVHPDCQQNDSGIISGNPVEVFGIEEVIPHQQYMPGNSYLHDIALIRLDRQAPYTDFIRPICLPGGAAMTNRYEGSNLTVAGQVILDKTFGINFKIWLQLPVVANEQCAAIYARHLQLNANQMCAGGLNGTDTCSDDAGGPLMSYESVVKERPGRQWVSTGIVSMGPAVCGREGKPGIYTRVGPYVNWILDQMKP